MNDEDLREALKSQSPYTTPVPTETDKEVGEAVSTQDALAKPVDEDKKDKARSNNPFTSEFWMGKEGATAADYGFTNVENPNDIKFTAEAEGIVKDPRAAIEYYSAPFAGALDTGIGLYNVSTPGPDIPQLPKFANKGAQLVRDISSVVIPGLGTRALIGKGAGYLQTSGKLGAWASDPLVKFLGTNAAQLGGGALVDLAAPIQGDAEGQTLLGSIHDLSPRHMGWIPESLRILDGDSPDDARRKNMLEGAGFGALGGLLEGAHSLYMSKKGLRSFTEYIPENETARAFFSENQPTVNKTLSETLNANAAARSGQLEELGYYNSYKNVAGGYDLEESIVFGKDNELYSFAESGVRSADDMGIVGSMVDAARIDGNIDTVYGRLRNPITEGSLNLVLDQPGGVGDLLKGLGSVIDEAGDFAYKTATGKMVSKKAIKEATDKLVSRMLDMPMTEIRQILDDFSTVGKEGVPELNKEGRNVVKGLIEQSLGFLADPSAMRAAALTDTAYAGQVADMAWGMRMYDGTESVFRLQDQLLERIQYLQTVRGITAYSRNALARKRSAWSRLTGTPLKQGDERYAQEIQAMMPGRELGIVEAIDLIQENSKSFTDSLRAIARDRPQFLKPMALAYELTDGDARSVAFLNNYLRNSTGTLTKAVVDGQPEIPSVIMQGFWSTAFNSALSGIKTPLKAGVSNLYTWGVKPITEIGGAYLTGDRSQMNRAFYGYSQIQDTLNESFTYAKRMFVKSGESPHALKGRDELVYKTDEQMKLFKATADAAEAEGNLGPAALYDIMQTQKDLAEHPWLRLGNRSMLFSDAWNTSQNAQMYARLKAYDEVTQNGRLDLDQAKADEIANKVYLAMFDENGIIKDEAVLGMTARQTFSQDNFVSSAFQDLMNRIPGLKPFFMFTRSPVNSLSYGASFQPVGAFIDKTNRFSLPVEEVPTEKLRRLLSQEGVDVRGTDVDLQAEYTRLRNEYKGRSAMGMAFVGMGVYGYLSGNITGRAGLRDRQKQMVRVKSAGWKPMKAFGVDYSQIPAVSDWVSLTIDIMDNAFQMDQADVGELLRTMGYVIGANITERTQLQNIEQFSDVLGGNPAAIQRWASNTVFNSTTLVGGMLGTMNQIMAPQLKAVEQRLDQLVLNRIPGKPGLPDDYDFIEGGQVGTVENPVLRLYNALSPFPYHAQPSDAKQYLIDVEFNAELGMSSRTDGVPYTKAELSEIKRLMGEDGQFKRDILRIRSRMPAAEFRSKYAEATRKGLNPDVNTLDGLHAQLVAAQERAKTKAESQLPELMQKKREEALSQRGTDAYLKSGDIESAERWVQTMQQRGLY